MKKKIQDSIEFCCFTGIAILLYDAFNGSWKFWLAGIIMAIICFLHSYEIYKEKNKDYYKKEKKYE